MGFTVTGWDFSFKRSSHQTRLHSVISTRCCREDETVNKDVYLHVNTPGLPQSASSSCEPPPAVSLLQPRVSRQINGLEQYVMIPTLWHHHACVWQWVCVCSAPTVWQFYPTGTIKCYWFWSESLQLAAVRFKLVCDEFFLSCWSVCSSTQSSRACFRPSRPCRPFFFFFFLLFLVAVFTWPHGSRGWHIDTAARWTPACSRSDSWI